MDNLLKRALQKIELDASPHESNVKESCKEVLISLDAEEVSDADIKARKVSRNAFFQPLQLACKTTDTKLILTALDTIAKLSAHGYFEDVAIDSSNDFQGNGTDIISPLASPTGQMKIRSFSDIIIESVCGCSLDWAQVQLQVIQALLTVVTSSVFEVHQTSLLLAVRTIYAIHLSTQSPVNKLTARASLQQLISHVFLRMENDIVENRNKNLNGDASFSQNSDLNEENFVDLDLDTPKLGNTNGNAAHPAINGNEFSTVYQLDAFLLFRALCKLSMKDVETGGEVVLPSTRQIESKILSLDLLLCIMEQDGIVFRTNEIFLTAISKYLCTSLRKNANDSNANISGFSLKIIVQIYKHFSAKLQNEIETFVEVIYLRKLESSNIPQGHRRLVLDVLCGICNSPNFITDIFVRHDCDPNSTDLYARIISALGSVAKGRTLLTDVTSPSLLKEESQLRLASLQGLICILTSLSSLVQGGIISPKDSLAGEIGVDINEVKRVVDGVAEALAEALSENSPSNIASYLLNNVDCLGKSDIGVYLGMGNEYSNGICSKVLNEYINQLSIDGIVLDEALRNLSQGLCLPTNSLMQDRILEKFSEQYCIQNPLVFRCADDVFMVANRILNLSTRFNCAKEEGNRIPLKEDFLNDNKDIVPGINMDERYLEGIFDRIKELPIEIFVGSYQSGAMPKQNGPVSRDNSEGECVGAMFEVAWWPLLGAFSHVLEELGGSDAFSEGAEGGAHSSPADGYWALEREMISVCLDGCRKAINLAAVCIDKENSDEAKIARTTFINGLAKFTLLDTAAEMTPKNAECIKTLIIIATEDNNSLNESWGPVLRYISQLARLLLYSGNLHTDDIFYPDDGEASVTSGKTVLPAPLTKRQSEFGWIGGGLFYKVADMGEITRSMEKRNAETVSARVDSSAIDRVFENSKKLTDTGIRHLIQQLCNVSKQEIDNRKLTGQSNKDTSEEVSTPRFFSLQRLIEVANLNMDTRSRLVWIDLWKLISAHLVSVGAHDNVQVALYAMDSVRQLAIKYIAKNELQNFNYQRIMLSPFEQVMTQSQRVEVRQFIVRCLDHLIRTCHTNLRSGWKSVFSILEIASRDSDASVTQLAWPIMNDLVKEYINELAPLFLQLTKCLLAFVNGPQEDIGMAAVARVGTLAGYLNSSSEVMIPPQLIQSHLSSRKLLCSIDDTLSSDDLLELQSDIPLRELWWPILFGLSENVSCPSPSLRHGCLDTLTRILTDHGHIFSTQTWRLLLKGVLAPMMEGYSTDPKKKKRRAFLPEDSLDDSNEEGDDWVKDAAPRILSSCTELFFHHGSLTQPLLPEMLAFFKSYVCQPDEALARISLSALADFIFQLEIREEELQIKKRAKTADVENKDITLDTEIDLYDNNELLFDGNNSAWDCLTSCLSAMLLECLPTDVLEDETILQLIPSNQGTMTSINKDVLSPVKSVSSVSETPASASSQISSDDESEIASVMSVDSSNIDKVLMSKLDALMTKLVIAPRLLLLIQALVCCHSRDDQLSPSNLSALFDAIDASAAACRRFNNAYSLRRALGLVGFLTPDGQSRQTCEMLRQEISSYSALLQCLIALTTAGFWPEAPLRLGRLCRSILTVYSARDRALRDLVNRGALEGELGSDVTLAADAIEALIRVVVDVLETMRTLLPEDLEPNKPWVYRALVGLISTDSSLVRSQVAVMLADREPGLDIASY